MKIHKEGKPMQVPLMDIGVGMIEVVLMVPDAPEHSELADAEGNVTFAGGVKPGTYKMAVFQRDEGMDSDLLNGAFSRQATKITIVVPDNEGEEIDLGTIELNDY
jgi:hypothetical protein